MILGLFAFIFALIVIFDFNYLFVCFNYYYFFVRLVCLKKEKNHCKKFFSLRFLVFFIRKVCKWFLNLLL